MFLNLDTKLANAASIARDLPLRAGVVTAGALAPVLSFAAEGDIDSKITEAGTKIIGYGTAVVGIMVGFWAVKRAGQKMGWW